MSIEAEIITGWIKPNNRVLDLGCGDGSLLAYLKAHKQCCGVGIEINEDKFNQCLAKGVNVIDQNLDKGLDNFQDKAFDIVVLSQTLQALHTPDIVLEETLRIGKQSIVAFPNFGHWRARLHLIIKGKMPVSKFMPHNWYNTPNIHFCTVSDFETLCQERGITILNKEMVNQGAKLGLLAKLWPNLFTSTAFYHLSR